MTILRAPPLATVADFLEQPNGHSIATYVSGCGIDAARYADELSEQVSEAIHTLVLTLVAEAPEPIRAAFEATDRDYEDLVQDDDVDDAIRGWECALGARPLAPLVARFDFLARRRRQLEGEKKRAALARREARRTLAGPLVALLRVLVPVRVEASSPEVLWAACRTVALAAESRAQWEAFVGEAPVNVSLSDSLTQRFPEMAEESSGPGFADRAREPSRT